MATILRWPLRRRLHPTTISISSTYATCNCSMTSTPAQAAASSSSSSHSLCSSLSSPLSSGEQSSFMYTRVHPRIQYTTARWNLHIGAGRTTFSHHFSTDRKRQSKDKPTPRKACRTLFLLVHPDRFTQVRSNEWTGEDSLYGIHRSQTISLSKLRDFLPVHFSIHPCIQPHSI